MSKKKTVFNAYDLLNSPEMSAYLDQVEAEEAERQKRRDAEMAARQRQSGSKPGRSVSDDELSADALKRDNIRQTTDDISGRANDVWQALKSGGAQLIQGAGWLANEAGAHDSGQFLRDIGQIGEDQALANMTPAGREAQKNGVFKEDLSGVNDDWGRGMAQGIAGSAVPSIVGAVLGAPVARGIGAAGDALLGRAAVSEGALGSVLDAAIKYTPAPVMRLAGALPGAVGAGAGEAAVTGATNGAQAYQEVMDAPIKSLRKSPAFQSLSKELGSEDAARKAIADRMSIQTAKDTALSTGLIGAAMGGGAVGSLLNKFAVKQGAKEVGRLGAKAAAKEVLKDGAKEFTEEFAQSGPEHYLQNAAKRDYLDPTIDPSTGMLRASLEGGVVGMGQGMGMSGGAHAVNRLLARNEPQPSQPANTPQQQPNTQPSSTPEPVAGYDPIAPNQQALLQRLGVEPDPAADEAAASVASIFGAGDPTAGLVASVMRGEALQPIHDMAAVRANTVLPVGSNEGGLYEPQWLPDAAQGESANGMRMPRRGFDSQEQLLANAGMDAQDMQRRADIASQVDAAWAQQQNPVQKARELESLAQESAVQVAIDRAEQSNQINQALANAAGEGMAVPNAMQLALQQAESRRNSAQNLPDSVMTKALTTELKPNSDAGSVDVQRKTTELPTELPTELKSNSVDAQRTHGDDKSREIATNHASVESKAPNTSDQAPNISSEPALTMQQNERGQWIIKGDMAQHAQTIRDALPGTKLVVSQKSGQALVQMPADKNTGKQGKAIRKALDHLLLSGEQLAARDQQRANASERAKAANKQAQQIDHERDDIVNAVAKLGGIDTEQALSEWWRGQRETIGHYNAEVPGNLRRQGVFAFKRGGMAIDDMVRHLEGEGYLPHNATPNDLLDALENRSKHPAGYEADARREFDARQQEEQTNAPGEFQQAYHDGSFADDFMLAALEEDGYFDLNRQQREAIEAAAQVADDQFWSDAYDGKLAVTPTEEQLDEIFGPERVAGQSQADETAGADDAGGTGAGARSVQEDGNAQSQENEFSLAGYTESDLRREEQAAEQQQREVERQRAAADKARQDEETRKEIRRRSEAAADTFTLGGNAEDNLTGQGGLFDAPAETIHKPISKSDGSGFATRDALRAAATRDGIPQSSLIEKRDEAGNWIGLRHEPDGAIDRIITDQSRAGKVIGTSVRDLHSDDVYTLLMAASSKKQINAIADYIGKYAPRAAADAVKSHLDSALKQKGWATEESLYGGGMFDAPTESSGAQNTADNNGNWLNELFGNDGTEPAQQSVQRDTGRPKEVDFSLLVPKIRAFVSERIAEADDWAGRKYKHNEKQIHLDGDGPAKHESISISSANESRRRSTIDNLTHQANAAKSLIGRIERGENISHELAQAIEASDADIETIGKPRFGKTRNDQAEAYISNMLLGDRGYRYGKGTLAHLLLAEYENFASTLAASSAQNIGHSPENTAETPQNAASSAVKDGSTNQKLENFGEQLPPARRAFAAKLGESLSDDEISSRPLSQIWPASENEAIQEPFAAAVAHVLREAIPSKPRTAYKVKAWVGKVRMLRELAAYALGNRLGRDTFMEKMKGYRTLDGLAAKIKLLEHIDRSKWNRIGDVAERPHAIRYGENGEQISTPSVYVTVDGRGHLINGGSDLLNHLEAIKTMLTGEAAEQKMKFEIRHDRNGTFFINKVGDKEYRRLMEFSSAEDARKALRDQYADVVAAWEAVKARDNITERDLRTAENRPRVGADYRKGADVSAEDFEQQFGFRGGEFGKWVEQGKGSKDRQTFLNNAYDALMDLANILGLPPKAISLEGSLGIAFGSRGSGWASAHFEPSNLVINLTKTRGAGALAHEWFHALDNYFSRKRGGEVPFNGDNNKYREDNYITHKPVPGMVHKNRQAYPVQKETLDKWRASNPNSRDLSEDNWMVDPKHRQGVRPEVESAFHDLVKALNDSPMLQRSKSLDGSKTGEGYWSRTLERAARAFENYVQVRMMADGYHNDFLANVRAANEVGKNVDRYPYLLQSEIAPIADSFQALFDAIQHREADGGKVELYSKANAHTNTQGMPAKELQAIIAKALPAHLRERVNAQQSARSEDNDLIEAEYDPATGQLTLYADAIPTPERALFVLSHELTHYGLDAKYGFGLSSILLEARNNPMIAKLAAAIAVDRGMTVNSVRQDIADARGVPVARVARSVAVHRLQVETANEALAELNAAIERNDFAYLQDRYGVAVPKMMRNDLRGRLSRLAASVKAWLAKLTGKQATDYSDKQVWDLLAGVRETVRGGGKLSAGYSNGAAQHSMAASSKTINVVGVTRPTTNSNGQPIAQTEEGLRNFWRWFGDSKVVDAEGKPLVVYHGTAKDISEFDVSRSGQSTGNTGFYGAGAYFTQDTDAAASYAGWAQRTEEDAPNLIPAYLSIQRPVYVHLNPKTEAHRARSRDTIGALVDTLESEGFFGQAASANEAGSELARLRSFIEKADFERSMGTLYRLLNGGQGVSDLAQRAGFDGVLVYATKGGRESLEEAVAFEPTQVKSAVGNQGTFNASDPNIFRSTAPKQPASAGFVLPEETTTQQAQREVQDNMNRWRVVLKEVQQQGGQVDEQNDVYSAEERFHGRAATRIEDFARDEVEPLMERLADSGHTLQEVEQYLLAQHAEEANARIREIDDSRDTAFGMEDGEAQSILAKFAAMPDAAEFKRLANDFRRISEGTLSLYVKAGIVSPEAAHAMRQAYQFYVPVKGGDEDQAARQGMGKGLSVNGKQKRRMGHDMRDEHVLENMLRDRQRAIVLAEKNNVGTYLLDLIERNPDPKLWTVNVLPKQKVLRDQVSYVVELNGQMLDAFNSLEAARVFIQAEAARTGSKPGAFAVSKSSDPYVTMMAKPTLQDHEVQVYVQGRAVRIQLHDPILAGQYRRMGTEQMGRIIEAGKSLNRWLSKVYTGYNPEFFIKNVVRDLFAGSINLTADQGGKVAAKALSHWPKAGAAMFRFALTGKAPAGEYGKALQRYRAAGGSTGAAYMGDLERQADTLQTLYENYSGAMAAMQEGKPVKAAKIATRKLLGGLAHWFEVWNQAGENAFRLATFMAMEDAGKTVAQSASMAKNVTVNFNRKGELTPQLGALYLFFNPNVQGTARMYQSLFGKDAKHKAQAWAMVGAMAGARLALAAMGRALMGDDEWEEIPDGVKDRNLIIALGNGRKLTIPLPYGYSFFASMANRLDAVMHGESAEKASVRLASAVFENFSPVGNPVGDDPKLENTLLLLPTALKIPALPAANLSGFGGQMRPEYDRSQPDNEKMYRGTRGSLYDKAAQAISGGAESIGIGSRYENDWADISPETIKYLVKTLTGGTGGFLADSASLLNVLASGSTPDVSEVPFVRSGMRESTVKDARARFHELGNEAKEHVAAWKRAVDAGDDKAATEYEQDGELMAMGEMLEGYRKQATALRDLMAMEMQREDLTLAEKRMKQKAYENQEAEVYRDFIRQFKH